MPDSFWDESSSDESAPPDESDREESEYRAREHQLFDTEMCSPHLHPLDPKRLILPLRINAHELERRRHIPAIHEDPPYPYVTGHAIFRGGGVPETLCYDRDAFPNMVDFLFPCEHKTHHPVLLPPTLEAAEFLKVMRFSLPCYSCNLCPTFVSEHHHAFGEVCNTRCVICRPVQEPSFPLENVYGHSCSDHMRRLPGTYLGVYDHFIRSEGDVEGMDLPHDTWHQTEFQAILLARMAKVCMQGRRRGQSQFTYESIVNNLIEEMQVEADEAARQGRPVRSLLTSFVQDEVFRQESQRPSSRSSLLADIKYLIGLVFIFVLCGYALGFIS